VLLDVPESNPGHLNVGETLVDEYTHIPLFPDMVYNANHYGTAWLG
jgi:hypothetical protein